MIFNDNCDNDAHDDHVWDDVDDNDTDADDDADDDLWSHPVLRPLPLLLLSPPVPLQMSMVEDYPSAKDYDD